MTRGSKHVLPSHLPTSGDAGYARLSIPAGPWDDDFWVVVPHAGTRRRHARTPCQVNGCDGPPYHGEDPGGTLCYAHYWQWHRDGSPAAIAAWASQSARPPLQRTVRRRLEPRGIDFAALPPLVALEIRCVVAAKITRGDWTANHFLRVTIELIVAAVRKTGDQSLLDRRPRTGCCWHARPPQRPHRQDSSTGPSAAT